MSSAGESYNSQLPHDAIEVVQRMLSRKKLLAAQGLNFDMQAPQQQQTEPVNSRVVEEGAAGQNMVAALLNGAGLTEEELSLVSDAVQQVFEEHMVSPPDLEQTHPTSSRSDYPNQRTDALFTTPQHSNQPQHQGMQDTGADATAGSLHPIAWSGLAPQSISEIMKAEHELEMELMQLTKLHSRKSEPSAATAAESQQTTTAISGQLPTTVMNVTSIQETGDREMLTADMLSAVLEDPDASVDDIMNILSYVMSQKEGNKSPASAGQPSGSSPALEHGVQHQEHQQQQVSTNTAAAAAGTDAAQCISAATATDDSDPIRSNATASELAARLLQQARAKHGLVAALGASAHLPDNTVHQAPGHSISPWQSEDDSRCHKSDMPHASLPSNSPTTTVYCPRAAPTYRDRNSSPTGSQRHGHAPHGSYAELASARAGRRVAAPAQGEAWSTPAQDDNAFRSGLRVKDGTEAVGAAEQVAGRGRDGTAARILPGFGGSEAQEWLGYDGLMGLSSTAQQQKQKADSSSGAVVVGQYKAKFTPELDAKLQQLYGRNVDWKRRCEDVYARQRRAEAEAKMKDCTFAPVINKKSAKIVQKVRLGFTGRPGSALSAPNSPWHHHKQLQRSASTGKLSLRPGFHEEYAAKEDEIICNSKKAAHDAAMRAASAVAAALGEEAGRQLMQEMLGRELVASPAADMERKTPVTSSTGGAGAVHSIKAPRSGSASPKRAWMIQDAALRLYEDAFEKKERAATVEKEMKAVERRARSWSAPRSPVFRDVAPRVYEHFSSNGESNSPKSRREGSAPPECTFKPQTNSCSHKFPRKASSSTGGKRASPLQSPSALRSSAGNPSCHAVRRLDDEFKTAVETIMHEQQKLDVGIRQLLNSTEDNKAKASNFTASAARPNSAPATGDSRARDDAGWKEFITRQGTFLLVKEAKAAQVAAQLARTTKPQVSPGSKRILKEKERAQTEQQLGRVSPTLSPYRHCTPYPMGLSAGLQEGGSPAEDADSSPGGSSSAGSPYLDRVQQQVQVTQQGNSPGDPAASSSSKQQQGKKADWGRFTFKPTITSRAAAKKPRSVEEMSEGDRLRREAKLEQLRILEEARRLAGVTFSPDMSPTRSRRCNTAASAEACSSGDDSSPVNPYEASAGRIRSPSMVYEFVKPRIQLKGPGLEAYLNSLELKRRELEEKRKKLEEKRQKDEMAECTFKPITTPVPAYLTAWANMGYAARFSESKAPHTTMALGQPPPQQQQQARQQQQQLQQWCGNEGRHLHAD